jgi:hypothetical protein
MKVVVAPIGALVAALLAFPAVFATGDPAPLACAGTPSMEVVLTTIRTLESGGDYTARASGSTVSGAYQFLGSTWNGYGGFPQAWQAPPPVQDAKATEVVVAILDAHDGDVAAVPMAWYLGYLPEPASPAWDTVPAPGAGNRLTPRVYQRLWLAEYEHQAAGTATEQSTGCLIGGSIEPLADGFAHPGPPGLFAVAPVDSPHHDYPAWDWPIPTGTPIYALRGGRVVSTMYWPHNWWDYGCAAGATGCSTCGIGVTVEDDAGVRWTYCHGDAVLVGVDDVVAAGQQVLVSGNTGRSSGPHLHLQVRTPDGLLRCPQPLLGSLRDMGAGQDPHGLPATGCSY